jgi:hypothetical protein
MEASIDVYKVEVLVEEKYHTPHCVGQSARTHVPHSVSIVSSTVAAEEVQSPKKVESFYKRTLTKATVDDISNRNWKTKLGAPETWSEMAKVGFIQFNPHICDNKWRMKKGDTRT